MILSHLIQIAQDLGIAGCLAHFLIIVMFIVGIIYQNDRDL